jgi:hypothetical protein
MTMTPTTAWGALLVAANILEQRGLAQGHGYTLANQIRNGRVDPFLALQLALWPDTPPSMDGEIPEDRVSGRPYWAAVARLKSSLGRDVAEFVGGADTATVAAAMRAAAGHRPTKARKSRAA